MGDAWQIGIVGEADGNHRFDFRASASVTGVVRHVLLIINIILLVGERSLLALGRVGGLVDDVELIFNSGAGDVGKGNLILVKNEVVARPGVADNGSSRMIGFSEWCGRGCQR